MPEWITGIIGTIVGIIVGAFLEERKTNKEKEKDKEYVTLAIINFLIPEIEYNFNVLGLSNSKNLTITKRFELQFYEYEKAKYLLLRYPSKTVKDINKLYSLFYDYSRIPHHNKNVQTEILNEITRIGKSINPVNAFLESPRV